jgi:CheY-like chemotaxis protein
VSEPTVDRLDGAGRAKTLADTPMDQNDNNRPRLKGIKVLLVEDDPITREALEVVLTAHGAQVLSADSAPDALGLLDEQQPPTVLVSDIGLPEVDGYELMRRIRAREAGRGRRLPAIAVSGFADASREAAEAAGFDGFVAKPFDVAELVSRLRRLTGA